MRLPLEIRSPSSIRTKLLCVYALLIAANLGTWAWALIAFHHLPLLLGTALLAYSFGLRHAVDADHIAAIDNVTRKLMQEGKRPVGVGLFFSLGHSTVVVLASIGVALAAISLEGKSGSLKSTGQLIGTSISAGFLLLIAGINLMVLANTVRTFNRVKAGEPFVEEDLNTLLSGRGFLARIFRPLFGIIRRSWHMYPLGFLFGLGFDTATEISLLGISAAAAGKGLHIWSILIFPALFTAGMSLVDTTDGILMLGAYGWAFVKPLRKLYYNITITFVSVIIAVAVGGIEALGLIGDHFNLDGSFWRLIGQLNDHFGLVGFAIIAIFALSWLTAAAVYRWKGYDRIELPMSELG